MDVHYSSNNSLHNEVLYYKNSHRMLYWTDLQQSRANYKRDQQAINIKLRPGVYKMPKSELGWTELIKIKIGFFVLIGRAQLRPKCHGFDPQSAIHLVYGTRIRGSQWQVPLLIKGKPHLSKLTRGFGTKSKILLLLVVNLVPKTLSVDRWVTLASQKCIFHNLVFSSQNAGFYTYSINDRKYY